VSSGGSKTNFSDQDIVESLMESLGKRLKIFQNQFVSIVCFSSSSPLVVTMVEQRRKQLKLIFMSLLQKLGHQDPILRIHDGDSPVQLST
jgi:hypothetical protein